MKSKQKTNESTEAKRQRSGALKQMNPQRELKDNFTLATFTGAAAIPNAARMAKLVTECKQKAEDRAGDDQDRLDLLQRQGVEAGEAQGTVEHELTEERREYEQWLAPQLIELFADALYDKLDPKPFEDFATIIRNCANLHTPADTAHPFHHRALALAERIRRGQVSSNERRKRMLAPGEPLPITCKEFIAQLGGQAKEHDDESYERRELKRLGITFSEAKRGRPKKGTATSQT